MLARREETVGARDHARVARIEHALRIDRRGRRREQGFSPLSAAMLCATTRPISSDMYPVFGTPVGTGVGCGGGKNTVTPARTPRDARGADSARRRRPPCRLHGQCIAGAHRIHGLEGRRDHRVRERQRAPVGEMSVSGSDLLDRRVLHDLDAELLEETREERSRVSEAAHAEMARERLRGEKRERRAPLQPLLLG